MHSVRVQRSCRDILARKASGKTGDIFRPEPVLVYEELHSRHKTVVGELVACILKSPLLVYRAIFCRAFPPPSNDSQ
eukprot:4168181-Pyramimonas_sp.AAC.1